MDEFKLIELILQELGDHASGPGVTIGPGDDAAVLEIPDGHELVVTTDVLNEGTHFPLHARGDLVGYRAVAVNLSDLAAMGAEPRFLTVALTIEHPDVEWITDFAHGIAVSAKENAFVLVGGNLTKGPKSIAVTAYGSLPNGSSLLRSGARAEQDLWLTGKVGASTALLKSAKWESAMTLAGAMEACERDVLARYFVPPNRITFATQLRNLASAAIDVSDGLSSESQHLASASECGIEVDLTLVPLWENCEPLVAVAADDSYELLFTAPRANKDKILTVGAFTKTPVTMIGRTVAERTVGFYRDGAVVNVPGGYTHF